MKQKLLMTLALAVMLVWSGNVWGQTTVSYDFADGGAVTGLNEASPGIALDANIGFGSFKNSASTDPAIYSEQLRLYQNAIQGGSIKIYASNGVTITQVIVHASGRTGPAAYTVDGGVATDLSAGTTYTMTGLSATSVVEFYQKDASSGNRIYVDDFEVTYTFGGNPPPVINNIVHTPTLPNSSETVFVSADVTDDGTVDGVELHWGTASGALGTTIAMSNGGSGDTYTTSSAIPTQADGTTVYYEVYALDDETESTTSLEQSYTVTDPVPTITLSETSLSGFTYVVDNGPSAEQSFTVEGSNLTNDISIAATTNYEISESSGSGYTSPITLTKDGSGAVASTTIYVRLKAGLPLGDYNDEDITASSGVAEEVVTCSGNVSDGSGGGTEDFANFPETSTSYADGTFTGQDGSTWTYVQCAGASGGNINAPTPYLGKGKGSEIYSGSISGGIGTLSFDYKQVFSSNVNLNVLINGNVVGTVTTSSQSGEVLNSGSININVAGSFVIKFDQVNTSAGHVAIDNLIWTGFSASSPLITLSESSLSGFTYATGSGPSPEQSFTAEGTNLTDDITITPPTNYEISLDNTSYQSTTILLDGSSGSVATTTIYVRLLAGLSAGDYNSEDIVASSTDATSLTITCSGSVYEQIDWANLQSPASGTIERYGDFDVYAQVYEPGITNTGGQGAGIDVWIGYSTTDSDPSTWTDWVIATYNTDIGDNDEYMANIGASITAVGTYYYASRFQLGSAPYVYGGFSGGFWDGTTNVSGELTVEALPQLDWVNLQWPGDGSINVGDVFNVYAQVYEPGITEAAGQGAGITAWIGYSTTDTDPWTWSSSSWITASFNGDAGSNDEYTANISSTLPSGTYYYASRFQLGAADYVYGGFSATGGGFWEEAVNVSGVLTINVSEPTSHATSFTATANSSSKITVSWTDAVPFVEGYLIKGSTVGYGDIANPVDGTEELDGELIQNVGPGIGTFQFTGLTPSTEYFFKIYPYNGTGVAINYNIDENVPMTSATTDEYVVPILIISEVTDAKDVYQTRFIELYNPSSNTVNFDVDDWYLSRQTNGGSWEDKKLSGLIAQDGKYVSANSNADASDYFYVNFGFMADFDYGGSSGNGDDGYFLYYGGDHTSGTLIDAYGVIDEDGTGKSWDYEDTKAVRLRSISSPNPTWTASEWSIPSQANVADMTPSEHKADVTWQGTTDSDWNTKGDNWSGTYGFIPDASFNVTIPTGLTNYPTLSASGYCNSLIIQSDATGDGSLLGQSFLTVSGTTTVQRYTTAGTWHGISGPLDNDDFNSLYFNGNPDVWGKSYNESSNTYTYATDLGTDLGDAKGWMVWIDGSTAQTFNFTGDLRSGTVGPVTLLNSGSDPDHGYNFVGNPFPSAIDWEVIQPTTSNIGAGIWIWDYVGDPLDDNKNWATYLIGGSYTNGGSKDIAMGQGFFVQVDPAGSGTFEINESAQLHSTASFMKEQTTIQANLIKLKLNDGTRYDESIIRLNASATEGYDSQLDMHKMFSWSEEQPQLYSTANNFMTVNTLPLGTVSVPMDVRGVDGNEMTIAIEEVTDFTEIYLSDDYTGVQTNLMEGPYTFVYDAGQTDRFTIYFTVVGTDENTLENVQAYSFDQKIRVVIPMEMNAHVEVTNILGQTVDEMDAQLGTQDIQMDHGGYYLVHITGDNQRITRKVFIK